MVLNLLHKGGSEVLLMLKNRRSIRLKGYDYSQSGAYFITICLHNRIDLFGSIALPEPVGAGLVPALMGNDIHENTYEEVELMKRWSRHLVVLWSRHLV